MSVNKDRCSFAFNDIEKILREHGFDDLGISLFLDRFPKDWTCWRRRYRDSSRCIFHSRQKDVRRFAREFKRELRRMKRRDKIDFAGVIFPGAVRFSGKEGERINFDKPAFFVGATFKQVEFDVMFDSVLFDGATFEEEAHFDGSTFKEFAVFTAAWFLGNASFEDVIFQQAVSFNGCKFHGIVKFARAAFDSRVVFDDATFNEAWFDDAIFYEAWFNGVAFRGRAWFDNSVFLGSSQFRSVEIEMPKAVSFAGIHARTHDLDEFWDRKCESIDTLALHDKMMLQQRWGQGLHRLKRVRDRGHMALDMVEFLGTDVGRIQFRNEEWGERTFKFGPFRVTRRAAKDELDLYEQHRFPVDADFGAVAALYRQLRSSYEQELRYPEAGDFYVGEMEMRRLQISTWPKKRMRSELSRQEPYRRRIAAAASGTWAWLRRNLLSPIAWYRNFSLYGESYRLASLWVLGTILAFVVLRIGFVQLEPPTNPHEYPDNAFTRSVLSFFQLRSVNIFDNVERIVSAFVLGMLLIALRRRFERR